MSGIAGMRLKQERKDWRKDPNRPFVSRSVALCVSTFVGYEMLYNFKYYARFLQNTWPYGNAPSWNNLLHGNGKYKQVVPEIRRLSVTTFNVTTDFDIQSKWSCVVWVSLHPSCVAQLPVGWLTEYVSVVPTRCLVLLRTFSVSCVLCLHHPVKKTFVVS